MKKILFLGLFSLSLTFAQAQTAYLFQQNYLANGAKTSNTTVPLVGLSNPATPSPLPIDQGGAEFILTYQNGSSGVNLLSPPATPAYVDPQIVCSIATQSIAGDLIDSSRTRADIGYIVGYEMAGCASTFPAMDPSGTTPLQCVRDAVRFQYTGLNGGGTASSPTQGHRLANTVNGTTGLSNIYVPLPNSGVFSLPEPNLFPGAPSPLPPLTSGAKPPFPTQPLPLIPASPNTSFTGPSYAVGSSGWILNNTSSSTQYLTPTAFSGAAGYSETWTIFDQNTTQKAGPTAAINIFPETYVTETLSGGVPVGVTLPYKGVWPEMTLTLSSCYPSSRYVVVITSITNPKFAPTIASVDSSGTYPSNYTSPITKNADFYSPGFAGTSAYNATLNFNTSLLFPQSGTYNVQVWEAVPINLTGLFLDPASLPAYTGGGTGGALPSYLKTLLGSENSSLIAGGPIPGGGFGPFTNNANTGFKNQYWMWHIVPNNVGGVLNPGGGAGGINPTVVVTMGAVGDVVTP